MTELRPPEQAQAPPEDDDIDVAARPVDGELQLGGERCALMTHDLVVSMTRDGVVIVRVFGHKSQDAAKHIGISPKRSLRLGARFIQAALHADPSLINEFDSTIATARGRGLRVIGQKREPTA